MRAARHWRALAALAFAVLVALPLRAAEKSAVEARMRADVTFLASDECEGRGVATKGINLAADYIANEFKKAGLKPAGADGTYFQPFTMINGPSKLGGANTLRLRGPLGQEITLKAGDDFQAVGLSSSGKVSAPLVFAGYGATTEKAGYDDYADLDVAGKIVVVLRKTPRAENEQAGFEGGPTGQHGGLLSKMLNAEGHKAAAVLFVNDPASAKNGDKLMPFEYTAEEQEPSGLPAAHVRRDVADGLLRSSLGAGLREVEQDIDREMKPRSGPLAGWTATLDVSVERQKLAVKNVVGVLEGAGPLAKETVVIGAHYDHLGYGGRGSRSKDKKPEIHHGADDNASGSTTIMELARRFAAVENRQGRRLMFVAFSGEEMGLFGSAHYVKEPPFPLADTITMVNLDMVGRMTKDQDSGKDKLLVEGTGTAKQWDGLLERVGTKHDFKLLKDPSGFGPSDHASFYGKKVPVLFFWTGNHKDYHLPTDTADKINVAGMDRVAGFAEDVINYLGETAERPEYVKIQRKFSPGMMGSVPRIGFQPAYGDDGDGVMMEAVSEGGPAAKAGLKDGDRIVEIAGKPVKNMEGYMALMAGRKKGEPVEMTILRDGKKLPIKVVPE